MYTADLFNKLEAVQRDVVRFAYSPRSNVTEMLQRREWDSIQMKRSVAQLTMMFKIVNSQIAIPASNFL